jgi:hypothetical protein
MGTWSPAVPLGAHGHPAAFRGRVHHGKDTLNRNREEIAAPGRSARSDVIRERALPWTRFPPSCSIERSRRKKCTSVPWPHWCVR